MECGAGAFTPGYTLKATQHPWDFPAAILHLPSPSVVFYGILPKLLMIFWIAFYFGHAWCMRMRRGYFFPFFFLFSFSIQVTL